MVAAMAVELFIYLYAFSFLLAAIIAIVLLVAAARRLAKLDKEKSSRLE